MISINVFCCYEKVFILASIWMIVKSLMKQDTDYLHAKRVFKDFEIKNLGEYHDLYLKSEILPLTDVFETFRNVSLKSSCKVFFSS